VTPMLRPGGVGGRMTIEGIRCAAPCLQLEGGASGPWTETHTAQQEAKGSAGVRKEACERIVGGGGGC